MKNQLSQTHLIRSLQKFINFFVILILLLSIVVTVNAAPAETASFFRVIDSKNTPTVSPGIEDPDTGIKTSGDIDSINAAVDNCDTTTTLMGCWKMETKYGNVLTDGSFQHLNNAIAVNNPNISTTRKIVGNSLNLNGTNEYAYVSDNTTLDFTTQMTLAVWVRPGSVANQVLVDKTTTSGSTGYRLDLNNAGYINFRINQPACSTCVVSFRPSTAGYQTGAWMHIAATYHNNIMTLYVNGVYAYQTGLTNTTIGVNATTLRIGAQNNNSGYYDGRIDEVRVYNVALTASQVNSLFLDVPTAVTMNTFSAAKASAGVQLSWETVSEASTAGFNLYRREASGNFVLVNDTLIPPQVAGQPLGATYFYLDTSALPNRLYEYKLETIDTSMNVSSSTLFTYWPYAIMLPMVIQ
jgi:hypothetical protein